VERPSPRGAEAPQAQGQALPAEAPLDASPEASASLAPLPGFFEGLPVAGHPDAWLSLPTNATSRRPVVIVVHGMGDRPDWQCGGWRRATAEQAFVLCPRGKHDANQSTKDDWRYTLEGGKALLAYIDAALDALAARYSAYVDTSRPLLAGFSLGASEVLALAVQDPQRFPRVALVEGATGAWPPARIDTFRAAPGARVLFGAGQKANEAIAKTTAKQLNDRGLEARVVFAPVGHTFDPPLEDAVLGELAWFVDGDDRWTARGSNP
jgi:predicted esterase